METNKDSEKNVAAAFDYLKKSIKNISTMIKDPVVLHQNIQIILNRNFKVGIGELMADPKIGGEVLRHPILNKVCMIEIKQQAQKANQMREEVSEEELKPADPVLETAKEVFDDVEKFWHQAENICRKTREPRAQGLVFAMLVDEHLKSKGVSFGAIAKNPKASAYFTHGRLLEAMILSPKIETLRTEMEEGQQRRQVERAARDLGRKHGAQEGLLTQAGVKGIDDRGALRRGIKRVQVAQHPDRNPEPDTGALHAANELADMIKNGTLDIYLEAQKEARAQAGGGISQAVHKPRAPGK